MIDYLLLFINLNSNPELLKDNVSKTKDLFAWKMLQEKFFKENFLVLLILVCSYLIHNYKFVLSISTQSCHLFQKFHNCL